MDIINQNNISQMIGLKGTNVANTNRIDTHINDCIIITRTLLETRIIV